jgi:hypothetical protein
VDGAELTGNRSCNCTGGNSVAQALGVEHRARRSGNRIGNRWTPCRAVSEAVGERGVGAGALGVGREARTAGRKLAAFIGEKIEMVEDADPSEATPSRVPPVEARAVAQE